MTFTEAAAEVLRLAGKPLHYKEITEMAIEKNLIRIDLDPAVMARPHTAEIAILGDARVAVALFVTNLVCTGVLFDVRAPGPFCIIDIITIATSKAQYRASAVVLALGRAGTPNKLGIPGE